MSDFFEKYKDPRWQKRRLEIMQNADFACELCGDDKSTLNVHHKYYIQGNEPWEYNDNALVTYCDNCHNSEHDYKEAFSEHLNIAKEIFTFNELYGIIYGILSAYHNCDEHHFIKKDLILKEIESKLLKNIQKSIEKRRIKNG